MINKSETSSTKPTLAFNRKVIIILLTAVGKEFFINFLESVLVDAPSGTFLKKRLNTSMKFSPQVRGRFFYKHIEPQKQFILYRLSVFIIYQVPEVVNVDVFSVDVFQHFPSQTRLGICYKNKNFAGKNIIHFNFNLKTLKSK